MSSTPPQVNDTPITPERRELKVPNKANPLSVTESFKQYFFSDSTEKAEFKVLSMLPFFPESDGKRTAKVHETEIKKNVYINDFHIVNTEQPAYQSSSSRTLVMLHGWGTGMGLWFENLDAISSLPGWNIHVLDNPGMGRSTRETFNITQQKDDVDGRKMVAETEEWYLSRLEAWREKKGIERFVLLGHSLGGYIASIYAMKYPHRVERLILVSPVGVEHIDGVSLDREGDGKTEASTESTESTEASTAPTTSNSTSAATSTATSTAPTTTSDPSTAPSTSSLGTKPTGEDSVVSQDAPHPAREFEVGEFDDIPDDIFSSLKPVISENQIDVHLGADLAKRREQNKLLAYMWQSHYSFIGAVRIAGPMGPKLVARWSYIRFQQLPTEQRDIMHIYAYRIFAGKASGERGLTRLMAPFCIARVPLIDRISNIKCPSFWIYGENDWMNTSAGHEAAKRLNKLGRPAHYKIVADAGHHIYLDNIEAFNKSVVNYLKDADEDGRE
ncbi:putative cardiolipin-specific deacylase [Yarrowia sp. E02]|nr:putative cardiolipin-specific deacylase [Yarrowia sp. E02]